MKFKRYRQMKYKVKHSDTTKPPSKPKVNVMYKVGSEAAPRLLYRGRTAHHYQFCIKKIYVGTVQTANAWQKHNGSSATIESYML
jgi:hypothetical protein